MTKYIIKIGDFYLEQEWININTIQFNNLEEKALLFNDLHKAKKVYDFIVGNNMKDVQLLQVKTEKTFEIINENA